MTKWLISKIRSHLRKKHKFITAEIDNDHTNLAVTGAGDIDGDADDCADSFSVPGSQLVEHSSSSSIWYSGSGEKDL